jgi:endonuclease-3
MTKSGQQKAKSHSTAKQQWLPVLLPLFKEYGQKKHPLEHRSLYELIVAVILSSQTTDERINALTPAFFKKYPSMKQLSSARPEDLYEFIRSVRSCMKKAKWLVEIARRVGDDTRIPRTMEGLTKLPGIGRKSANVIIRESGGTAEGIVIDLHVARVVPRLGLTTEENVEKMEKKLMEIVPREHWNAAGMSFSFLGRELCRPMDPRCTECLMKNGCAYYKKSPS